MTSKEYLQQIENFEICIAQRKLELEQITIDIQSVAGIDYAKDRVQTTPTGDSLEKAIIKKAELENEICDRIAFLGLIRHEIINQIQNMPKPKYVSLLYKRYVEYKALELIAVEMNYTYDHVRDLHVEALSVFKFTNGDLSYFKFSPQNPT